MKKINTNIILLIAIVLVFTSCTAPVGSGESNIENNSHVLTEDSSNAEANEIKETQEQNGHNNQNEQSNQSVNIENKDTSTDVIESNTADKLKKLDESIITYDIPLEKLVIEAEMQYDNIQVEEVYLDTNFKYATYSQINTGFAKLYKNNTYNKKEGVVCINAGHGVKGGEKYPKTYAHPDFTKKLTQGTNGTTELSYAISSGMTFPTGQTEHEINLKVAIFLRDVLLSNGYSVLMIREDSDSHLDNIARTVLANNYADCHVSLHFDSTETNSGIFCITASRKEAYLEMEPVKSTYKKSDEFANMIITTLKKYNEKLKGKGIEYQDLTQISYSTIPTIDLELGDKMSDISDNRLYTLAKEVYDGIDEYMKLLYEKKN